MNTFFTPLKLEYLTKGYYKVLEDVKSQDGRVVPAGFITDLASVPAFARSLARSKDIPISAVFHDFACSELGEMQLSSKILRLNVWLSINERFRADLQHQGRHISSFRVNKFIAAVNLHAKIKVNWFNRHPDGFVKLKDLKRKVVKKTTRIKRRVGAWFK